MSSGMTGPPLQSLYPKIALAETARAAHIQRPKHAAGAAMAAGGAFGFDRMRRLWQWRAGFPSFDRSGARLGQTGMGHQADLPQLRHPLLRSAARAGYLPEMQHAL